MSEDKSQNKSIGFASGLILGTITAGGAVFLYKTKKGKKLRQILSRYHSDINDHLNEVIKRVKKEVKRVEGNLEQSNQIDEASPSIVKKPPIKRTKNVINRRVFRRSGKPLIK